VINKNKPLDIYREDFENAFLSDTREYYARESTNYIANNGVAAYLKRAERRIEEEHLRGKKLLDTTSWDKLKKECDTVLVDKHKDLIVAECENYLRDDRREGTNHCSDHIRDHPFIHSFIVYLTYDTSNVMLTLMDGTDLNRMYRLMCRIEDGIRPMLEVLQSYVTATGFTHIKNIPPKDTKVQYNLCASP
jgi:hypothetical protein